MSTQAQTFIGLMLPPEALLADDNIRFSLKPAQIEALATDILAMGGVMQNLEVEELEEPVNGSSYRITDGHYRHAAVKSLNKKGAGLLLPCTVVQTENPTQRMKRQLSSAMLRENLTLLDMATAVKKLTDAGVPKMEIRQIFSRPGGRKGAKVQPASNSYINILLSFLDFPKNIRNLIQDGVIGFAAAYKLTTKPKDRWDDIVKELEEEYAKDDDFLGKLEERYLADQRKSEAEEAKQKEASQQLEEAKARLHENSVLLDQFVHAETEALVASRKRDLDAEAKKAAEAKFKEAKEKTEAAVKLAAVAKKEVTKLEEKLKTADERAEERKAKLEQARKDAAAAAKPDAKKPAKKQIGPSQVDKAAAKVGAGNLVALKAQDMRKAVEEWALPGSFPKIQQIFAIVVDCFAGGITPAQAYSKMGVVTGERKAKSAGK